MRVVYSLAVAGLTMAGQAQAADLFGTAPPPTIPAATAPQVEVGSNWYVLGNVGISFDKAPTVSISSLSTPPPGNSSITLPALAGSNISATDFTGGLGFGYRFNDYVRLDATWDYRTGPSGTRQTTVVCPYGLYGESTQTTPPIEVGYLYNTTNTCNGVTDVHQHNNTFLANGYVDLGTYAGFTPFVGGGLGFNINSMQGNLNYYETANGQPYAADLTPTGTFPQLWVDQYGGTISPQPNIAFTQQNWNRSISTTTYTFAWAVAAGIGFQINPSTTLDVGYRYLNSGSINTLVNPQTGMTIKQSNTSQQILVGVRYVLQ